MILQHLLLRLKFIKLKFYSHLIQIHFPTYKIDSIQLSIDKQWQKLPFKLKVGLHFTQ